MPVPWSLVVTCWESADLLAVVFVVFCHLPKCFLVHIRIKDKVGAVKLVKPSRKIFYRPFQGGTFFEDLLCFFCLVFVMPLCASVYLCLVATCWERVDLLTLVGGV